MIKSSDIKALTKEFSVIYAEDEPVTRKSMVSLLGGYFKTVDLASDGAECLEMYQDFYKKHGYFYDIVITDLEMPKMKGLDLIRALKEINPDVHSIIFSAYSDYNHLKQAITIGVDGFLEKPLNRFNFLNILYSSAKCILAKNDKKIEHVTLKKEVEKQTEIIKNSYRTDHMTGLPNSAALLEELDDTNHKILILLDIDRFSDFNYTYGIKFGDGLIKECVGLLQHTLSKKGELYRLGSDEFVVLFDGSLEEAENYVQLVFGFFEVHPISYKDIEVKIRWNIGISLKKTDKISAARIAVKLLKENPGASYNIYKADNDLLKKQQENIEKVHFLKNLMENEEEPIVPYFQPIVDVQTKEIIRYESLARIESKEAHYTPDYFIDAAKSTKLLSAITKNMISKSFKIAKREGIDISINITEEDFNSEYLVDFLRFQLEKNSLEGGRVALEILEDITTNSEESINSQIKELKDLGFKIAIDDFGRDKSNFARLMGIKADIIKIDGLFVKDLEHSEESVKIVKSIIYLAKEIGAKTIAEYVSSENIFNIVKDLGADYVQGFFFGKPVKF